MAIGKAIAKGLLKLARDILLVVVAEGARAGSVMLIKRHLKKEDEKKNKQERAEAQEA